MLVVSFFHHSVYYDNSIVVYMCSAFVALHDYTLLSLNGGILRGESGLFSSCFVNYMVVFVRLITSLAACSSSVLFARAGLARVSVLFFEH